MTFFFYSGCNNVQDILLVSITRILSLRNVLRQKKKKKRKKEKKKKKYVKTYFFLLLKTTE